MHPQTPYEITTTPIPPTIPAPHNGIWQQPLMPSAELPRGIQMVTLPNGIHTLAYTHPPPPPPAPPPPPTPPPPPPRPPPPHPRHSPSPPGPKPPPCSPPPSDSASGPHPPDSPTPHRD